MFLKCSSSPGTLGLNLSHNFMSSSAVGIMITAAAHSGHYPASQGKDNCGKEKFVPLWLRVDQQQCRWAQLSDIEGGEQRECAQKLLRQKEKMLIELVTKR